MASRPHTTVAPADAILAMLHRMDPSERARTIDELILHLDGLDMAGEDLEDDDAAEDDDPGGGSADDEGERDDTRFIFARYGEDQSRGPINEPMA